MWIYSWNMYLISDSTAVKENKWKPSSWGQCWRALSEQWETGLVMFHSQLPWTWKGMEISYTAHPHSHKCLCLSLEAPYSSKDIFLSCFFLEPPNVFLSLALSQTSCRKCVSVSCEVEFFRWLLDIRSKLQIYLGELRLQGPHACILKSYPSKIKKSEKSSKRTYQKH